MSIADITTELPSLAKEAISTWILLPIVWYYMKNFTTTFSENLRKITENQAEIFKWIKEMNKTILTDNVFIEIITSKILLFNSELLQFLTDRLEKNNIKTRRKEIEDSISAFISEYKINHYCIFDTLKWENIWDVRYVLNDEIYCNQYLNEIFDIFFNENKTISDKIIDFKTIWKSNHVTIINTIRSKSKSEYNFTI